MFWLLVLILLMAIFGVGAVLEGILQLLLIVILVVLVISLVVGSKIRARSRP